MKYQTVKTKERVVIGDTLKIVRVSEDEFTKTVSTKTIDVTKESIPYLIKEGYIEEVEEEKKDSYEKLGNYLAKLREECKDIDFISFSRMLKIFHDINPGVIISLVLRLISKDLYNDTPVVTENGTYFCVQRSSGKIIPVVLSPNDERLAILTPFKTMEDAMKAKEVVQKYIDAMHE